MKRFTRLMAFMAALFSFTLAYAETGTETELTASIGSSNNPVIGQCYQVDGTYNAGPGSSQAGNMTSKGFKCRTGVDGNRVVFTVSENYTIKKFVGEGISNYAMADGAEGEVNVFVTKVEVDGVEVDFSGGQFPAKGSDYSGNLTIDNIEATQTIAIYFDNSNSAGKQLNLTFALDWERPDASQPTITVKPSEVKLIPGATYKLTAKVDPTSFATEWISANESIATVAEDGTVTALTPGTVEISHQWVDDASVKSTATINVVNFNINDYVKVGSYDFTAMGDVSLEMQSEAAANIWNQANSKTNPVYFCTNEGLEKLAVQAVAGQTGKGWSIVDGEGLYLGSGAGRCAAIDGIVKGQFVEFIYTGNNFYTNPANDDGIEKETLNESIGHAIFCASEDGMIGFELDKGNAVLEINIYESDQSLPKFLTFPDYNDKTVSSYTAEWTATVNGAVWTLNGFNNNNNGWNYVRCGRKNTAHTATLLSPAFQSAATDVVYTVDKTSNVVRASVIVLNGDGPLDETDISDQFVEEIDITEQFVAGDVVVKVQGAPGYRYMLTVDSDDQASSNGTTQISKVGIYGEGQYAEVHIANTAETAYTVAKAIELIDAGDALSETVFVKGIISQIDNVSTDYGNATYWISDDGTTATQLECYRGLFLNGENFTSEDQLQLGATVIVTGTLTKYNNSIYEFNAGNFIVSYEEAPPVPEGTYYVMCASEEGDWFMAAGHNWGTRAIINNEGLDVTLIYDAPSGKYTIETNVYNRDTQHFLGSNLYMDSDAFGWTIAPTSSITFTISDGEKYIGIDSDFNLVLTDTPAEWAFIDAAYLKAVRMEEGLEALKAATKDNGVDATFLLKDPQFNRNDHRWAAWTVSENCTNKNLGGGCDTNSSNGCAESYHSPFTISQLVEGAPAGVYTLTAQGFYRQDGEVEEPAPWFFIGDATGNVPVKTGEENNMTQAGNSFEQGLYTIDPITFVLGEGGELVVGVSNGENVNQWVIWDNFRLTYYGENAGDENMLDVAVNVQREVGMGYGVTVAEADLEQAKAFLGVEELTTGMLFFENPDGSLIDYQTYAAANYDGWCNGDGAAENWGSNTKICVKFFQAIPEGKFEICDMNGADVPGATYSVKWQLQSGEKAVRYTVNVTFFKTQTELEVVDKGILASVSYDTTEPDYIEKTVTLTDEQVSTICQELGIGSLEEGTAYGYNPTTQELVKNHAGYDGWRDANGDFHNWNSDGTQAPACVKYTDGRNYLCYNRSGMEPQTIKCFWTIANAEKAVLVEIDFIYTVPEGITAVGADELDGVKVYNLNGQQVKNPKKGLYIVNGKKTVVK